MIIKQNYITKYNFGLVSLKNSICWNATKALFSTSFKTSEKQKIETVNNLSVDTNLDKKKQEQSTSSVTSNNTNVQYEQKVESAVNLQKKDYQTRMYELNDDMEYDPEFFELLKNMHKQLGIKPPRTRAEQRAHVAENKILREYYKTIPYEKIKRKEWYFSDKQVLRWSKWGLYIYGVYYVFSTWIAPLFSRFFN